MGRSYAGGDGVCGASPPIRPGQRPFRPGPRAGRSGRGRGARPACPSGISATRRGRTPPGRRPRPAPTTTATGRSSVGQDVPRPAAAGHREGGGLALGAAAQGDGAVGLRARSRPRRRRRGRRGASWSSGGLDGVVGAGGLEGVEGAAGAGWRRRPSGWARRRTGRRRGRGGSARRARGSAAHRGAGRRRARGRRRPSSGRRRGRPAAAGDQVAVEHGDGVVGEPAPVEAEPVGGLGEAVAPVVDGQAAEPVGEVRRPSAPTPGRGSRWRARTAGPGRARRVRRGRARRRCTPSVEGTRWEDRHRGRRYGARHRPPKPIVEAVLGGQRGVLRRLRVP